MQITCSQCHETLSYAGSQPKFCSNCGQSLSTAMGPVVEHAPRVAALSPQVDPEAPTLVPASGTPACGTWMPETIGGYKLLRALGGGGMGTVYEAEDVHSNRRVALKVVLPQFATSREALARFRQEGELASSLAHPRCVFVLGADEDEGRPYIVMELMTGETLQDVVKRHGPMPPERAIRAILDVIEGLEEAHRLGLVHRDVKPSNCFLEPNGRVKIGDFGLARSLIRETHLTRTGTFLGTPLYSSPEQVKAEKVDAQSDVYSVAATLYFLLTGQAPFQSTDAMATLARIVSDDPPSMRTLQTHLPKGLDRAVLRGLERDRKRRWKDVGEFRKALVRFLPVQPSIGDTGVRLGAWLIDLVVMQIMNVAIIWGVEVAGAWWSLAGNYQALAGATLGPVMHAIYFGLMEGILGWSLGKGALRLRVWRWNEARPPGVLRAALRMLILTLILSLGYYVTSLPVWLGFMQVPSLLLAVLGGLMGLLGLVTILVSMRRSNGYRGLHEWISGTRTVRLTWPRQVKRPSLRSRVREAHEGAPAEGLPDRVGPYLVRGLVHRSTEDQILLAEEPNLKRRVWIWLRPADRPSLTDAQRQLSRTTRQRWLSGGRLGDRQWDAFLAPRGEPLALLIRREGAQPWGEARLLLEHLADELALSVKEGSLPSALGLNQVRLHTDGQIQIVEMPLDSPGQLDEAGSHQQRCLASLRQVATVVLEGRSRTADDKARPIAAPLPGHARRILGLLIGQPQSPTAFNPFTGDRFALLRRRKEQRTVPYERLEQFLADLAATQQRPVEVQHWPRAKHLLVQLLFIFIGVLAGSLPLILGEAIGTVLFGPEYGAMTALIAAAAMGFGIVYFCSELSFRIVGIAIVRRDGRRASRWRRLARTLLSWSLLLPLAGMGFIALAVFEDSSVPDSIGAGLLGIVIAALLAYLGIIIMYPTRAPHDRIVGTYLVPE